MKENYSTKDYDDFIHKSTYGSRTKREQKSQYVPRERYNNLIKEANLKLKRWMIIALVTGAIGFGLGYAANDAIQEGIPSVVASHQVASEISQEARGFRSEYIRDNVKRTEDFQHYWYDYHNIYDGLLNYGDGDFDKNVYYAYLELGPAYTSELLDYSRSDPDHDCCYIIVDENGEDQTRSFRNYLYTNGYYEEGTAMLDDKAYENAIDNFSDTMKNRFEIEHAFDEKQAEYYMEQDEKSAELDQMMSEHNMDGPTKSRGGK